MCNEIYDNVSKMKEQVKEVNNKEQEKKLRDKKIEGTRDKSSIEMCLKNFIKTIVKTNGCFIIIIKIL